MSRALLCVCACVFGAGVPLLQPGPLCAQVGHFISQQANLPLVVINRVQLPLVNLYLLTGRSQTETQTQFTSAGSTHCHPFMLLRQQQKYLNASPTLLSVVRFHLQWPAEWLLICSLSHRVPSEYRPICSDEIKENSIAYFM